MKTAIILAVCVALLTSCSLEKPNVEKARAVAEACLKAVDKGDYKTVRDEYYTSEFVKAETEEQLAGKFNKLKEITGALKEYELTESKLETEMGEEACVKLTYSVQHERVTTREEFVVVVEDGKHKIGSHIVSNE